MFEKAGIPSIRKIGQSDYDRVKAMLKLAEAKPSEVSEMKPMVNPELMCRNCAYRTETPIGDVCTQSKRKTSVHITLEKCPIGRFGTEETPVIPKGHRTSGCNCGNKNPDASLN